MKEYMPPMQGVCTARLKIKHVVKVVIVISGMVRLCWRM